MTHTEMDPRPVKNNECKEYSWAGPKVLFRRVNFDKDVDRVIELLKLGLSVRKITKLLGYTNHIALIRMLVTGAYENYVEA